MLCHLPPEMIRACSQINRRGFDILVPHHAGEAVDIAAAFEHQRGKGVAQLVHCEREARALAEDLNQAPQYFIC